MVKSMRLEVVKDVSDFPYYRVATGQVKLNFAKMDDVLEFVKRHMTIDTDVPLLKGAEKEKPPTTTGVAKTSSVPRQKPFITRRTGKGVMTDAEMMELIMDMVKEQTSTTVRGVMEYADKEPYWKVQQNINRLLKLGRLRVNDVSPGAKNKRYYLNDLP